MCSVPKASRERAELGWGFIPVQEKLEITFSVFFVLLLRQEPRDSCAFKIVLDDRDPTEVQHNAVFFFLQNDQQLSFFSFFHSEGLTTDV